MILSKNSNDEKCAPKFWKSNFGTFSIISFGFVDSLAKIFLILYLPFENSTTRIAIQWLFAEWNYQNNFEHFYYNNCIQGFLPSLHRAEILTIFRLYFGRNDDFIKSFWNWLTFSFPSQSLRKSNNQKPFLNFDYQQQHLLYFPIQILLASAVPVITWL